MKAFSLVFALVIAAPVAAEPRLLIELTERGGGMWGAGQPGVLYFAAGLTGGQWDGRGEITGQYAESDIGIPRAASADQLERFANWLTDPNARFLMHIGIGGGPSSESVDAVWRTDWSPVWRTFTPHVPRLGVGLQGYNVTAVTQTLDYLNYTHGGPSGPYINLAGTTRIYGDEIPLPTAYPPLVGDYNKNGNVDAADYVVWRKLMSMPPATRPWLPNTLNGPREPHDGDWAVFRYYFGESVPPLGSAAAIPEPATWLIGCIAFAWLGCRVNRAGSPKARRAPR